MHYENKIYDITALEIFKRLEVFFAEAGVPESEPSIGDDGIVRERTLKFSDKIKYFQHLHRGCADMLKITRLMRGINHTRNEIVHPSALKEKVDSSIGPIVVLQELAGFERFRQKCIQLEELLHLPPFKKHTGMSEIMIPTLKYEMGNLGDIIKHGLLAELTEWWCVQGHTSPMVFADTFAGCPWGGSPLVTSRLLNLAEATRGNAALFRAYTEGKPGWEKYPRYLGSTHLVKRIRDNHNKKISLVVSDNDPNARSNLAASGLPVTQLSPDWDGFAILDDAVFAKHKPNVILLDPYGMFLRDEFHRQFSTLRRIAELTEANQNLWVVLFVLDMWPEIGKKHRHTVQETHDFYTAFRDTLFKGKGVYFHCPKARESRIKGESTYDAEVLLVSKKLENKDAPSIKELLQRLRQFSKTAAAALEKEQGLKLAGGGKVEYKEV